MATQTTITDAVADDGWFDVTGVRHTIVGFYTGTHGDRTTHRMFTKSPALSWGEGNGLMTYHEWQGHALDNDTYVMINTSTLTECDLVHDMFSKGESK